MRVDRVRRRSEAKIVRPQQDQSIVAAFGSRGSDPVFQRFDDTSDAFAYCWIWSTMMNSHDIRPQDVTMVDERGGAVEMIDGDGQQHDARDRSDYNDSDSGGDSSCGRSSCGGGCGGDRYRRRFC